MKSSWEKAPREEEVNGDNLEESWAYERRAEVLSITQTLVTGQLAARMRTDTFMSEDDPFASVDVDATAQFAKRLQFAVDNVCQRPSATRKVTS